MGYMNTINNDKEYKKINGGQSGADKSDINLYQAATDIVIKTGNFKRNIPLPNTLRDHIVSGAKFEDGILNISFSKGDDGYDE